MMNEKTISSETWELVNALLQRTNLTQDADAAFKQAYPEAPPHMIETATFHVATDGIGAALEWVASVERFLRDPSKGIDSGRTFHVLYHLYNWEQFVALLPAGRAGMLEWVNQLQESLADGDVIAANKECKQLKEMLEAGLQPPRIEQ
jgi:hypothetical protein